MENLKNRWTELAEKQSWLRKAATEYFVALNADLSTSEAEGEIEYILKTWDYQSNIGEAFARKLTVDMINGQIKIHICRQDYEADWDYDSVDPGTLTIANLRLLASKMPEILEFFESKLAGKIGKIDTAGAVFESYKSILTRP